MHWLREKQGEGRQNILPIFYGEKKTKLFVKVFFYFFPAVRAVGRPQAQGVPGRPLRLHAEER